MATRYTSLGTAALIAGSIGASVYTASTAQSAREAISAAHDVTTRHGEIAVRVDAGGADVTALAAVAPGTPAQVLTVSDSGVPVWRDPASGSVTASQISDSTGVGRAVLTAASPAAGRATLFEVDYDFTGSAGWTLSAAGGATATMSGGLVTFVVPSGVTLTQPDRPRASIPLTTVGVSDGWRLSAEANLASYDASGMRRGGFGFTSFANGANGTAAASTSFGAILLALETVISVYTYTGTTYALAFTAAATASLDGQDWLRLDVVGTTITAYYAHSASRPTASGWRHVGVGTWVSASGGDSPASLTLMGYRSDSTASVFTSSWRSLRVRSL